MGFVRDRSTAGPFYACGETPHSNPYEVLGIESCADQRFIQKASRKLQIAARPDKNPGNEYAGQTFVMARDAEFFLFSPHQKKHCDSELRRSGRCGKKNHMPPQGEETQLVEKFRARKAEIAKHGTKGGRHGEKTAFVNMILGLPLVYVSKSSALMSRSYAGITKTYRDAAKWPYGLWTRIKSRRPIKEEVKKTVSVSGRHPKTPRDPHRPTTPRAQSTVTRGPTTTFTVRETETVTATKMETETETVTVTAPGRSIRAYGHDFSQLVKEKGQLIKDKSQLVRDKSQLVTENIDPKHLGAGVIALACAAGCWYCVRGLWHRRRRAQVLAPVGSHLGGDDDDDDDGDGGNDEDGSGQNFGNFTNGSSRGPNPRRAHSPEHHTAVVAIYVPVGRMINDIDDVSESDEGKQAEEGDSGPEQIPDSSIQPDSDRQDIDVVMSDPGRTVGRDQSVEAYYVPSDKPAMQEEEAKTKGRTVTSRASSRTSSYATAVDTAATLDSRTEAAQSKKATAPTETPAKRKSTKKKPAQPKENPRRSSRIQNQATPARATTTTKKGKRKILETPQTNKGRKK